MSTKLSAGRVRSTYEFIKANRAQYSVQSMCRVLGVAPSGYYDWRTQPISNRGLEDARLLRLIRASFTASQGIYGAPRVFLDLREAGETCSKHRVARLMRVNRLRALHGYRTRGWAVGKAAVLSPNLLKRQFTVTRRNKAWVTDITYIRTWQGWLYLAVVMDLFSRKIVGWATRPTIHREVILEAVLMAVRRRRPRRTLIHSDQGSQYRPRRLATLLPGPSPRAQHEPEGQLLGQRRRRVVLQQPQEGAGQEADLQDPSARDERCRGLHRSVLQSHPPPQSPKRRESRAVRGGPSAALTRVSTESWELHFVASFLADVFLGSLREPHRQRLALAVVEHLYFGHMQTPSLIASVG